MAEHGQVISKDGNMIVVRMERTEACAKCRACIEGMSKKEMLITAINECNADVDNWVNIELEESGFLKAVLIMYGLPFIAMFTGFLAGFYISDQLHGINAELAGFITGLVLMLLSYFFIKKREGKWNETKYTPVAKHMAETPSDIR